MSSINIEFLDRHFIWRREFSKRSTTTYVLFKKSHYIYARNMLFCRNHAHDILHSLLWNRFSHVLSFRMFALLCAKDKKSGRFYFKPSILLFVDFVYSCTLAWEEQQQHFITFYKNFCGYRERRRTTLHQIP